MYLFILWRCNFKKKNQPTKSILRPLAVSTTKQPPIMKAILSKTLKTSAYTLAILFGAFVVYANWEPAPMHAYVKPISMTILKVDGLTDLGEANEVKEKVSKTSGVTACAANPASQLVSITFDPEQTSAQSLTQLVSNITSTDVQNASFEGVEPSGPECPVPHEYILAFERAKYALCFR